MRGAWVEIPSAIGRASRRACRSPCGERGLKFRACAGEKSQNESLPVRGAWVEIFRGGACASPSVSLPVRGAWVEIAGGSGGSGGDWRRSPCGERGLKSVVCRSFSCPFRSLPVRGAWVEIATGSRQAGRFASLPVRGAWVEMAFRDVRESGRRGRSPCGERGLKSRPDCRHPRDGGVAPRAGSVD